MIQDSFKSARDELMKRVEYRDAHLRQCLLALAVIYGLGNGIQVAGIKAEDSQLFLAYPLAYPVSLLFFSLYQKEELLVGALSGYIAGLSRIFNVSMKKEEKKFAFWDDSSALKDALPPSMIYRMVSVVLAFVIIPGLMLLGYFQQVGVLTTRHYAVIGYSGIIAVIMLCAIYREYHKRTR